MLTLQDEFKKKLSDITKLSKKINKNNNRKILEMIKEHVEEIEERYNNTDEHWTIETADLIILCYELLIMENKDIDDVFSRCLPRFDVKLKRLAENGLSTGLTWKIIGCYLFRGISQYINPSWQM